VSPAAEQDVEPRPLPGLPALEDGDFHALSEGLDRDPQYNDRRLVARRKLGAIAKAALERIAAEPGAPELVQRTSLHAPHAFNRMRVRRLWAYLTRGKKAKGRLKRTLGAELAKDLDAAYRNAYLCVALEPAALEVSLRVHPDAWYDAQNLANRVKREGLDGWLGQLNRLPGYRLRLDDWKGEWRCGELDRDKLEEFLKFWQPGTHGLTVERRWPAGPGQRAPLLEPHVPAALADELARLVPLFRFSAWSEESDHLFSP
jgi:hypothetical protein